MPLRSKILPSELRQHLGWIVLADVLPGFDDYRYRLIGTLVSQYFFLDATHKTIREAFSAWPKPTVEGVVAIHRKCACDKVVLHVFGENDWMGQGYENFESLYLPLTDDGKLCSVVMTVFVFDRAKVLMSRAIRRESSEPPAQIPHMIARRS